MTTPQQWWHLPPGQRSNRIGNYSPPMLRCKRQSQLSCRPSTTTHASRAFLTGTQKVSGCNSASETRPGFKTGFLGQAETPIRANRLVLQASPQSALESLFFARKPRNPSSQNRRRGLCFKPTGARYLTSWNVAARKPSAASEMDNQADTMLDSGGSTTNEPNCAAELAGRNCAHPWTSSVYPRRCI